MADFKKCLPHLFRWEGGLSDDPDDLGGLTNRGITWRFFQRHGSLLTDEPLTPDRLRALTESEAALLYEKTFWQWCHGAEINSQSVAETFFDFMINADQLRLLNRHDSEAIRTVQRCLNITSDGLMGPTTLAAINGADSRTLFDAYQVQRREYYKRIAEARPANAKFLRGWLARVDAIKFEG